MSLVTSLFASILRGGKGMNAIVRKQQPAQMLELYDMENCPFCRPVREVATALDLDLLVRPCPKGGSANEDRLRELGGKRQVPFLVDPNTGKQMYESKDIIAYLIETYGPTEGKKADTNLPPLVTSQLASGVRLGAGIKGKPAIEPAQPLELFSFEASPFARIAREKLCELGITYVLRNGGKQQRADMGTPKLRPVPAKSYQPLAGTKRAELLERAGKVQFPYLYDPNTDTGMFESKDIVAYLEQTYGKAAGAAQSA